MRSKLLHESDGQRTFVAVLQTGDEVVAVLTQLARQERLSAAQITAIGAFENATVSYFEWQTKRYLPIEVGEQVEVASLIGDIALDGRGAPVLHMHVVLGKRDGSAVAGHLGKAHVRPTLEVVIQESPQHLRRTFDPETGLALIDLGK